MEEGGECDEGTRGTKKKNMGQKGRGDEVGEGDYLKEMKEKKGGEGKALFCTFLALFCGLK